MKKDFRKSLQSKKGIIQLPVLAIGALVLAAITLPLVSQLVGKRVTTKQKAAEVGSYNGVVLSPSGARLSKDDVTVRADQGTVIWQDGNADGVTDRFDVVNVSAGSRWIWVSLPETSNYQCDNDVGTWKVQTINPEPTPPSIDKEGKGCTTGQFYFTGVSWSKTVTFKLAYKSGQQPSPTPSSAISKPLTTPLVPTTPSQPTCQQKCNSMPGAPFLSACLDAGWTGGCSTEVSAGVFKANHCVLRRVAYFAAGQTSDCNKTCYCYTTKDSACVGDWLCDTGSCSCKPYNLLTIVPTNRPISPAPTSLEPLPTVRLTPVWAASCLELKNRVELSFFKTRDESGYDAVADVNNDGVINIYDAQVVASHASDGAWCTQRLAVATVVPPTATPRLTATPTPGSAQWYCEGCYFTEARCRELTSSRTNGECKYEPNNSDCKAQGIYWGWRYCCQGRPCTPPSPTGGGGGQATATPTRPAATNTPSVPACSCPAGKPAKGLGNANCDDYIDMDDLALWYNQWLEGRQGAGQSADFNCDNKVDEEDLALWYSNAFQE